MVAAQPKETWMAPKEETGRDLRALERRLDNIENLLLRAWCAVVAALLVAGLLVPFGYDGEGDGDERDSLAVLTTPFHAISGRSDGADSDELAFGVLFVIGFIGLILVILGMLGGLLAVVGRDAGPRTPRVLRVLVTLAFIGTAVVLIFSAMAAGSDYGSAGPGGLVLLAGVLAYLPLLKESSRHLWVRSEAPLTRRSASAQPRDDMRSSTG